MTATEGSAKIGRPPKVDAAGRPTRERLLAAAADACVEHGFEGVSLADIATRAEVSTSAVYNHFSGKSALLVEACRWALERITSDTVEAPLDPRALARTYLSPEFENARRLQLELHLASSRHIELRRMLALWHRENSQARANSDDASPATVKAWYLLLLGLAQIDALAGLDVATDDLDPVIEQLVCTLFPQWCS